MGSFPNDGVTVPAYIHIGNACMLGAGHSGVTVLAIDLIVGSMNHMGKLNCLVRFVILLSAQGGTRLIEQFGLPAQGHQKYDSQDVAPLHLF